MCELKNDLADAILQCQKTGMTCSVKRTNARGYIDLWIDVEVKMLTDDIHEAVVLSVKSISKRQTVYSAVVEETKRLSRQITDIQKEYRDGDIVMSELLLSYQYLPVPAKQFLLSWSGDDEFVTVKPDGDIAAISPVVEGVA